MVQPQARHFFIVNVIFKRSATAVWNGSVAEGLGNLNAPSWVLHSTQYSFGSRFENAPGMSPEELIAAAHAGCYAMALAGLLGEAGFPPERLEVAVEVTMENSPPAGWTLTHSHLGVTGRVLNIDAEKFTALAEQAKACPIARALKTNVSLDAKLV